MAWGFESQKPEGLTMPATQFSLDQKIITLDARPDRLDLRDRIFTPRVQSLPPSWPADTGKKNVELHLIGHSAGGTSPPKT